MCKELGCGAGLVSLTLAKSGGLERIVATDGDAPTCALCRSNAAANGVETQGVRVACLSWGWHAECAAQMDRVLDLCATIQTAEESAAQTAATADDGSAPRAPPRVRACAELIVAADVLYQPVASEPWSASHAHGVPLATPLEATIRALIGAGGCRYVVIGWTDRAHDEEGFLASRLGDVGRVRTVWVGGDDGRNGIGVLEVGVHG